MATIGQICHGDLYDMTSARRKVPSQSHKDFHFLTLNHSTVNLKLKPNPHLVTVSVSSLPW